VNTGDTLMKMFLVDFRIYIFVMYCTGVHPAKYSDVVFGSFFQVITVTIVHVTFVLSVSNKV